MAKVIRRRWIVDPGSGLARRHRRSCEYEASVPDPLVGRAIALDGDVAADVADAETAIARLNVEASALIDTEALARILLRAESVASSRIEGLEIGARRLLRAEAARDLGEPPSDVTATEVLGNIDAMRFAVESVSEGSPITAALLLEIHRRLVAGTRIERYGGQIRTQQNWIGGSSYNPCSATYVPPPPELVADLLADLCAFCDEDMLPTVAQAAVAHAQFELIHPFVDGNGRTGRALIHLVLLRRGLLTRVLPPVSLVLATWANDYISGLTGTRHRGPARSKAAHRGINEWIGFFAGACRRAVEDATEFERHIRVIEDGWREQLGQVRAGSAADLILKHLPGAPVLTVKTAAGLTKRSSQATNEAVNRLVDAGVIRQITVGRRNRAFEAPAIVQEFTAFERQLASPEGDTRASPPARRVPYRRVSR
jgi:Fic family protein